MGFALSTAVAPEGDRALVLHGGPFQVQEPDNIVHGVHGT